MSEKQKTKILQQNKNMSKRNMERVQQIKEQLAVTYGKATNSQGENVHFTFNVIPLEVDDPKVNNIQLANKIAKENGLKGSRYRETWGYSVLAAVISKAGSGSSLGLATGMLIRLNSNDAVTLSHEIAHTFGLKDNYPNTCNGLMDYPPSQLSPMEVDEIWNNCVDK